MISFSLQYLADQLDASLIGQDVHFVGCSTDTRSIKKGELFVALSGPSFDGHDYISLAEKSGAIAVIVDRDVTTKLPVIKVQDTRLALSELARLWREEFSLPVIAITGSNGKTTVKEMISSILSRCGNVVATKGNLNNDIGVPQTLFNLDQQHNYAVIEMGANHGGEIASLCEIAQPKVAVVTQCAPSHLEGFGSVAGVAKAKGEIFEFLAKNAEESIAVINADDDYAPLWKGLAANSKIISFGLDAKDADVSASIIEMNTKESRIILRAEEQTMELRLPLAGKHNIMNALAATACALALNVSMEVIRDGLQVVKSAPGRLQFKAGIKNLQIIDDTYNANPRSYVAALDVLSQSKGQHWLALGDMGELGDTAEKLHTEAGEQARLSGVERMFTLGELSQKATESFGVGAQHFTDQKQLIKIIKNELDRDVTLLIKGSRFTHMERVVQALESDNASTSC